MNKMEYILNQFKRTWNKKYENYCIERLIFKLDNQDLQFVTQQMFRRNSGKIALADLYFPQLKLTVEVDEKHHTSQQAADAERTGDIIKQLEKLETVVPFEPEEKRIAVWDVTSLQQIDDRIDEVVKEINKRIKKCGQLKWEDVMKSVSDYLKQGIIFDDENASFKTIWEVSELFKKHYKQGVMCCYFSVEKKRNEFAWCPKIKLLGSNVKVPYTNEITSDGMIIYESADKNNAAFVDEYVNNPSKWEEVRYVFPYYKIATGENCYVFRGVFKIDIEETKKLGKRVWKKVSEKTSVDTTLF